MPDQLALILLALEPRLPADTHGDSWALSWMLAVGATYSLARARQLLPGQIADFRKDAIGLLTSLAEDRANAEASPTWSLGFYLNSTEARIQAGVHRVLRAFTGADGFAPALIDQIERLPTPLKVPASALQLLLLLRDHIRHIAAWDAPLARVWDRSNSVKHDPAQDISDQFNFAARWSDCRVAITNLVTLIDLLGTHCGALNAAA
jgi:hypothetical protein